jgi:hypothetical protein
MNEDELRQAAHNYAWNWFELHSKQRQQAFHFYLILIGSMLGAYFFAMRASITARFCFCLSR